MDDEVIARNTSAVAPAIIVGIGHAAAGDDGVGLAVVRELACRGFAVRESADASILLGLLEEAHQVVVIDAVTGAGPPGSVVRIEPDALASAGATPLSSHGLGVAEAIAIARCLYGPAALEAVAIIGVSIERPRAPTRGLSAEIAAAVRPAADLAAELVEGRG